MTTPPGPACRVYRLHIPNNRVKANPQPWIPLALVAVFVSLLFYFGVDTLTELEAFSAFGISGVVGLGIWLVRRRSSAGRRATARFRLRQSRLAAVAEHSDAAARLPHRVIEHEYYRRRNPRLAALKSAVNGLAPNTVVLVNSGERERYLPIVPLPEVFEPVSVRDGPGCLALLTSHDLSPATTGPSSKGRLVIRLAIALAWVVLTMAWLGYVLLRGARWPFLWVGVGLVVVGLSIIIQRWILGRDRYLVPGGIIDVQQVFWRRQPTVRVARRTLSPLIVVPMRNQNRLIWQGVLRSGQAIQQMPFNTALLSAWLSTARTPTDEEIASLLGQELD